MKNKHEILKELNEKCNTLIKINQNDKKKWLILNTISSFLDDGENFFLSCDSELALNVLMDLGYKKEEAKALYLKLISQN